MATTTLSSMQPDPTNTLFALAADFVNYTSRSIFLTGKAGTGKTTFLKHIVETTQKHCVVAAPTGVAAINAGGVTLHSLFQLPFGVFLPGYHAPVGTVQITTRQTLFQNLRVSKDKTDLLREMELLIIDEVSMVRCDVMDAIDAVLRHVRRSSLPFGGVQVLYIGDLFQLPPVALPEEWELLKEHYQSPFFFHAHAVSQAPPLCIGLEKIYRQNETTFIDLLNNVRNNVVTDHDLAMLNARYLTGAQAHADHITLTSHNYKADSINRQELAKLPGRTYEFGALVEGDFSEKAYPAEFTLVLKKGAKVMFIRNDSDDERRYFNGKLATVSSIDDETITVTFEDGTDYELKREMWENIKYHYDGDNDKIEEEQLGSFTQYPIRLAWAITIHKSQGLTFQKAIIDAGDSFTAGQVYVALSRCTSLEGITLQSRITRQQISTHEHVLYHNNLQETEESLRATIGPERERYEHQRLVEVFDFAKERRAIVAWVEQVPERKLPDTEEAIRLSREVLVKIQELIEVANKFQPRLRELLAAAKVSSNYAAVYERGDKAVEYFTRLLRDEIFNKLKSHIQSLQGKSKVKKYVHDVRELANMILLKGKKLRAIRLGDHVFYKPAEDEEEESLQVAVVVKREKGSSASETLTLFRKGYDIQRIATMRNFTVATIESHLARYIVTGELSVEQVVIPSRIPAITEAILQTDGKALTPIKELLGDDYSFGEIRAVLSHLEWLKAKK